MNEQLKQYIESYKELNWDLLTRKDLGSYSLQKAEPNLQRIKQTLDFIVDNPNTPTLSQSSFLNVLESNLNNFLNFTNSIINDYKDTTQKDDWIEKIKTREGQIQSALSGIISYLTFITNKSSKELEDSILKFQKAEQEVSGKLSNLKQKEIELEKIIETSKNRAQNQEVSEFGTFFGDTADANKKSAQVNLWLMVAMIVVTALIALTLNISSVEETGIWWKQLLYALSQISFLQKLILISLSGYLVAHFSRNYSVEMDQYVQNTHRQNALNSHKQIVRSVQTTEKSENDKEIQNAILLQATKAMFEIKQSGYGKVVNTSPVITNQILETVKKSN